MSSPTGFGAALDPGGGCPCGRRGALGPLPYVRCCGRWLEGTDPAPDAETLMRSRYTAYVTGRGDYLLDTWAPTGRPRVLDLDPSTRWLGLEVLDVAVLGPDDAQVEFVARLRDGSGRERTLRERSRFQRLNGRWVYVEAV